MGKEEQLLTVMQEAYKLIANTTSEAVIERKEKTGRALSEVYSEVEANKKARSKRKKKGHMA